MSFETVFHLNTPHGTVVGVSLPSFDSPLLQDAMYRLHPDEAAYAQTLMPRRANTWVGGRIALREAFSVLGVEVLLGIGSNGRGAPFPLPPFCKGSISHKETLAVGLASVDPAHEIGVDLELRNSAPRLQLASSILTPWEWGNLSELELAQQWHALLVRFALKEAIYKAVDPFVERYVGFHEVEIDHSPLGYRARLSLKHHEGPFDVELWMTMEPEIICTARIRR